MGMAAAMFTKGVAAAVSICETQRRQAVADSGMNMADGKLGILKRSVREQQSGGI
jgi:hypothetical protein